MLDVLDGVLTRLSTWGEARQTRHTYPSILVWRALANAITARDFDVAGWLLGIELPRLPGIDWNHIALVTAELAQERSKNAVHKLKHCLKASARPFKAVVTRELGSASDITRESGVVSRSKRTRTKKGKTRTSLPSHLYA